MKLTTTYRRVLAVLILLIAGWGASAQTNVVVGSLRTFKVPTHVVGHTFEWRVYSKSDLSTALKLSLTPEITVDATSTTDVYKGEDFAIRFTSEGDYVIKMIEFNLALCERESEFEIKVNPVPLIFDFAEYEHYEIVKPDPNGREGFNIPLKLVADGAELWKIKYLDITLDKGLDVVLTYTYYSEDGKKNEGQEVSKLKIVRNVSNEMLFSFVYSDFIAAWKETINTDHYFEFKIKSVKDYYGADVKLAIPDAKYIFGAYKKPAITKVNHTK